MIKQTYDELDNLLSSIADEADAAVPYALIKRAVLQKRRDVRRRRQDAAVRMLSAAAVLVILVGAGTLFLRQSPPDSSANPSAYGYDGKTTDPRAVNTNAPETTPGGIGIGEGEKPFKNTDPKGSPGLKSVEPKDFLKMSRQQLEGESVLKYTGEFGRIADEGEAKTAAAKVVSDVAGQKWIDNTVFVKYNEEAGAWIISGALVKAVRSDTAVIAIDSQAGCLLMVWMGSAGAYQNKAA